MQHGSAGRRSRKRRSGSRRNNKNKQTVFDSNGPDVRIRGTAHQVCDKYEAMAKDALSSNDYVLAQSYLQHAEHYRRILNDWDDVIANGGVELDKKSNADDVERSDRARDEKKSAQQNSKAKSQEEKKQLEDA